MASGGCVGGCVAGCVGERGGIVRAVISIKKGRPSQELCLTHTTYIDADFCHGLSQLMALPVRCSEPCTKCVNSMNDTAVCNFGQQHGTTTVVCNGHGLCHI
jgi:hypothetical protein